MSTTRYTRDHEWIRLEGDTATVGISEYAQEQLGDIVFVELPAIGKNLTKGDEAAVVESVKAASEIFTPMSGEVAEVNTTLAEAPGTVNTHPEGGGWFFKLKVSDAKEFDALMDGEAYAAYVETVAD
jgi:glycine cleavage system H protein